MVRWVELGKVGEGAFGVVVKAKDTLTGQLVAIKKVRLRHYGDDRARHHKPEEAIPNNVLREIKALQQLEHPNVVKLFDVFPNEGGGAGLNLVFEFMPTDLHKIRLDYRKPFTEAQVKSYVLMLLKGVAHCHACSILHRDLKPANLLIDRQGVLKLADFGLARVHGEQLGPYTHQVATRWYKAPELLYGARTYGPGVDLWSVGCILGELLVGAPLFRGDSDIDQLFQIVAVLGTPSEKNWPGISELPDFNKITFNEKPAIPWEVLYPDVSPAALKLMARFLVWDPKKRVSAAEALLDPFFFTEPLPTPPSQLPSCRTVHQEDELFDVNSPVDLHYLQEA